MINEVHFSEGPDAFEFSRSIFVAWFTEASPSLVFCLFLYMMMMVSSVRARDRKRKAEDA